MKVQRWMLLSLACMGMQTAHAQSGARPTVVIQVSAGRTTAIDSSSAYGAFRRGLEADGLVDVVAHPSPAKYAIAVGVAGTGDQVRVDIRVTALDNATVVHRMMMSARRADIADSLVAVAQRSARTLVAR